MWKNAIQLLVALLCLQYTSFAQIVSDTDQYEIAQIKVSGNNHSDAEAIIAVSGLTVGKKIAIPGSAINQAMKSIWKLRLFEDVEIVKTKTIGDAVFLEIQVVERPRLGSYQFVGIKKSQVEDLEDLTRNHLSKGRLFSESDRQNTLTAIKEYYAAKGYPNAIIQVREEVDPQMTNALRIVFNIDKRERSKILKITFAGNKAVSAKKLRKLMLATKEKKHLFKKSVLTSEGFAEDKKRIEAYYQTLGYRDAKIVKERLKTDKEGNWVIRIQLKEGKRYYFKNIHWRGNTHYTDEQLDEVLGIKAGDVYDASLLETRLHFSPNGRDISSLYMDHGHLFFTLEVVEKGIENGFVDLEIRLQEGPIAIINQVKISGNTLTKEEVIRRELRTRPGDQFSRAAVIRSQREIINLGYFNPEKVDIKTDVNPENGTVDLEYVVEERASDQIELSAGWDPASNKLLGTLGLQLNNFSIKDVFKKSNWRPLPSGDGQQLSLRLQSTGKAYQAYNVSFTEPWLGGKKPQNLSVSAFYTNRFYEGTENNDQQFNVLGGSVNLSRQLQFPDDNFVSSTSLNFQRIRLQNWQVNGFVLDDGSYLSDGVFYNAYLKQTIARSTINHPIFPTGGSKISLSGQATLPYSLLGGGDISDNPTERFQWLEYYKLRFDAEAYQSLGKKWVVKASAKMGMVGSYNKKVGLSPFERYWFGGDGLSGQQGFTGVDLISMRGYDDDRDFAANLNGGATAFSKFTVELRYPVLQGPSANIYALAFAEAGNAWSDLGDIKPFDLKRSAGLGLRIHLPMFGLLGFDYGIGFDKEAQGGDSFLSNYGKLSLILGIEPD